MILLSGGTGTPKLLQGIRKIIPDEEITVIVNTAEDIVVSGSLVSPDVDTILYLFSGVLDISKWWGIRNDTFHTNNALKKWVSMKSLCSVMLTAPPVFFEMCLCKKEIR